MCSKLFGGGSSKAVSAPTPAVSVAAPNSTNVTGMDTVKENGTVKAKGKRRLTIPVAGSSGGTGINV